MTFFNEEDELEDISGQEEDGQEIEVARQALELEEEAKIEAEAKEVEARRVAKELLMEEEVLNEQSQGLQDMDEMMVQATGGNDGGLASIPGVQEVIDALANAASKGDVGTKVAEVGNSSKDAGVKGSVEKINDDSAEQGG